MTMTWRPNCTEAPHYWTLEMPIGFGITYQVLLQEGGFAPIRLDYTKRDPQWERLGLELEILADAMQVCESAYRKDKAIMIKGLEALRATERH